MEINQQTYNLTIADFSIHLFSEKSIELEDGYLPFLQTNEVNADITIQCFAGIPNNPFHSNSLIFEARDEIQKFYSIFKIGKDLGFIVYDQQTNNIQQVAVLNEDFTQWKIYSDAIDNKIMPLKYPMGPIIMHYLTLTTDAAMMHASCAYDGKKGRMFSGFSGTGKSTMSKIWADAGNRIINDDRLIIRKKGNDFLVYNTPMYYKDIPKVAPLNAVYLIRHSPDNQLKILNGAMAVSRVMAFCIQNNFDKQFIQKRLNFFSDLCAITPVYDLGFVPNDSVVNFVLANEKGTNY